VSDTTFQTLRDYYPQFTGLHWISAVQAGLISSRTLRRADWCAAATEWARDAMIGAKVDPLRVTVVPFGSALAPEGFPERTPAPGGTTRLLAVTSDWRRKGGDRAVAVFEQLRRQGQDVSLTVVGDSPGLPDGVTATGRVDGAAMTQIYRDHDIVLEPARANTSGVTLTDAAGFGLPVVATDTGGVRTIVEDGVTGYLVDPEGDVVMQAADAIGRLQVPSTYKAMSAHARQRYEETLNWDRWAERILEICRQVV
jgi:alpha-maltose-1-phosphate synthase